MKIRKTKSIIYYISFAILIFAGIKTEAQEGGTLKLKDALNFGLKHNTGIQKSKLEIDRSQTKITESHSGYLPQVKGSVIATDNLQLQTSILPGEMIGQPGKNVPVQFGTQYSIMAGLDASQVIFDQSLLTGMSSANESKKLSELNQVKTEEQLIYDIATAYYAAEITGMQIDIIKANLLTLDTLINTTKSKLDNGFAKKTDYDRLIVNQSNMKTDLQNAEINYEQQSLLLKYNMGMPIDSVIKLPVGVYVYEAPISANLVSDPNNYTDFKILNTQKNITAINLKQVQAGYLPTLSVGFRYAYQAQQNSTDFASSQSNWFPNSYVALNLSVPIFDGFNKYSKTQNLKIQMEQIELDEQNLSERLKMQNINAKNKMQINQMNVSNQLSNVNLAAEVYKTTQLQYQAGLASISDLLNAETSFKEAETNYLKTLVQVKMSELEILKSAGALKTILN